MGVKRTNRSGPCNPNLLESLAKMLVTFPRHRMPNQNVTVELQLKEGLCVVVDHLRY